MSEYAVKNVSPVKQGTLHSLQHLKLRTVDAKHMIKFGTSFPKIYKYLGSSERLLLSAYNCILRKCKPFYSKMYCLFHFKINGLQNIMLK